MKLAALVLAIAATTAQAETYIQQLTQPDKISHYAAGATIQALGTAFIPSENAAEWALGLTVAAALSKEYYDSKHPDTHRVEAMDAGATALGGLIVYAALKSDKWAFIRHNKTNFLTYKVD